MTYTLILLRHGESEWNAKNLFTGWVDVALTDKGRAEAVRGGELLARGRPAARRRAHLAAAPRDQHRRTWRSTPPTGTGSRYAAPGGSTSATTAPCRARTRSRRSRSTARSSSCSGAARFDVPPPPLADDDEFSQVGRPALRRPRRRDAAHRVPQGRHRPDAALLGRPTIVPDLARRPDRAGRRPRQQPARARQAPRRDQRRRHRRAQHPHRHAAGLPRSTSDLRAHRPRRASTSTPRPPPPPPPPSPTRAAEPDQRSRLHALEVAR